MPREIKTTLAVDGEQAFKRAINDANTSIRNMGTQLTLAAAQFRKDGDAMKLAETRSKALNGQIGQQEEIVKALEKAVEDSTKAYGENSAKTEKWEAELNRAKARLVSLQNELTLNDQGLDRNGKAFEESTGAAADYQATLREIGKGVSFENISTGIKGITGGIEGAIKTVFRFGKALRDTLADAGEWADQLNTDATKYGMSPEELQRWQYAAELVDTDVETIVNARDKLTKKMRSGWKSDGISDVWEFFGIKLTDENGNYRDQMDVLWEVGESLMNMAKVDGNDVRASALAMEIFGKSYKDMLPLFSAGRDVFNQAMESADVVSEEHIKKLQELDDANKRLGNTWDVAKYSFLAELAPTITEVTDALSDLLHQFNEWMDSDEGKQAMSDLSDAIKELFSGLKDVSFKDAINAVKDALNRIKDALIWLDKHKNDVKVALEVIAGGFALLKLGQLATDLGKIVSGFKTLWLNAGKKLPSLPKDNNTGNTPQTDTGTGGNRQAAGQGSGGNGGGNSQPSESSEKPGVHRDSGEDNSERKINIDPYALMPVLVTAVAVAPAAMVQAAAEENLVKTYESAEKAAEAAEAAGLDAGRLRALNAASGPKKDENGGYSRNMLGFLDLNQTNQADYLLQSLGDPKKRGQLYADVMKYGGGLSAGGDSLWTAALRYWGDYREWQDDVQGTWQNEAGWRRVDNPLNPMEVNELIEGLREVEMRKLEDQQAKTASVDDAVAEMKMNTDSTRKAADVIGGMDLKKFNGLPGQFEILAARGIRNGMSGITVNIDGQYAGRILAPYINQELAKDAQ